MTSAPAAAFPGARARVRVGVRFDLSTAAEPARACRELLERAERCEALGLDVAWIGELSGSALALCAAVAARTQRLRIATAVVPLPILHPLRVAEDAASVDGISDGRLELGIGLGADAARARGFGLRAGERGDRLEEAVAVLRAAWGAGPLGHTGTYHRFEGVEVHPKPVQPGGPPLWLGVRGPAGAERAARLGLGALTPSREVARAYLEAWRGRGGDAREARVAVELSAAAGTAEALRRECAELCDALAPAGAIDLVAAAPVPGAPAADLERMLESLRAARPREGVSILGRPGTQEGHE